MSRSKDKGTLAESAVVTYLQENGWPYAERRALAGAADKGDVSGTPGLVWEVKYAGVGIRMAEWIQETVTERDNAQAAHGILVIKPFGFGTRRTGDWFAAMVGADYDSLLTTNALAGLGVFGVASETFSANKLRDQMTSAQAFVGNMAPVLTLRPRGKAEIPQEWYRVTTLFHMTRILRSAGYGNPLHS